MPPVADRRRPLADRLELSAPHLAVLDFWRGVLARYEDSTIENLSLEEALPGRIVCHARLHHRSSATGETLDYVIVQSTELERGRVVRQINVLAGG